MITRLTESFQTELEAFMARDLSAKGVRRDRGRLSGVLGFLGGTAARPPSPGHAPPVLAVGDGALGFWAGLRDVFPETKEQRCWVHKSANVLDALPKSIQPLAKRMLGEIRDAEDRDHASDAAKAFDAEFRAKWPKAADKIRDDLPELLSFFDFPAEHWVHLKTTNAIESTFATVRLRTKVTKGPGSRAAGLAMAFKLLEAAEDRWRSLNGAHLIPLVRAGAKFKNGVLVESAVPEEEVAA